MAKVLVVGMNPAWQITLEFTSFHWGQVNRAEARHEFVAGKGQNVAKVLSRFGHEAWLLQVIGGANGQGVEEALCRECLVRILIWNERHLRWVLKEFIGCYDHRRVHQGLNGIPNPDPGLADSKPLGGRLVGIPVLNGLRHDYRMAA